MRLTRILSMTPFIAMALTVCALGDLVVLKDGTRVNGSVTDQGETYLVTTAHGELTVKKSDVDRIVDDPRNLTKQADALREEATAIYQRAVAIEDAAQRNATLDEAISRLHEARRIYADTRMDFPEPEFAYMDEAMRTIGEQIKVTRDKKVLVAAPDAAPPKPGKPEEAPATAPHPLAVPPANEQKKAEQSVQSIFKAQYARKAPEELRALAQNLLSLADDERSEPATRYVLYREASTIAAKSGDGILALQAVDEMARCFSVGVLPLKKTVLGSAASATKDPEASKALNAMKTLLDRPEDAAANFAVGKHLCLHRKDWTAGLPMLAKGSNAEWRALAERELAVAGEAPTQKALADGWWTLADTAPGWEGRLMRLRAATWYRGAVERLGGLERGTCEQRIKEVAEGRYVLVSLREAATLSSGKNLFDDRLKHDQTFLFPSWGRQEVKGIPFDLIDPKDGAVRNAIVLPSPEGGLTKGLPKKAALPCRFPSRAIHLLITAGWGYPWSKRGSVSMIVRLRYAAGSTEDHELINGVHLATAHSADDVPGSERVFDLRGNQVRYLAIKPRQDFVINQIEFVKGPDVTAPVVFAATVELPE